MCLRGHRPWLWPNRSEKSLHQTVHVLNLNFSFSISFKHTQESIRSREQKKYIGTISLLRNKCSSMLVIASRRSYFILYVPKYELLNWRIRSLREDKYLFYIILSNIFSLSVFCHFFLIFFLFVLVSNSFFFLFCLK